MSNFIVSGGLGFIGAYTTLQLVASGHKVTVVDNRSAMYGDSMYGPRRRDLLTSRNIDFSEEDIADYMAGQPRDIDCVIHLAAFAGAKESFSKHEEYFQNNVVKTRKVFEVCAEWNIPVVYASSSSIYAGKHPYGSTKSMVENLAEMYEPLGLSSIGLRFFTVFGPFGRPDMALFKFAEQLWAGEQSVLTRNARREFTYITDIVEGIAETADELIQNPLSGPAEFRDISSGEVTFVEDAYRLLAEMLDKEPNYVTVEREKWDPLVTSSAYPLDDPVRFTDGLRKFADWFIAHKSI